MERQDLRNKKISLNKLNRKQEMKVKIPLVLPKKCIKRERLKETKPLIKDKEKHYSNREQSENKNKR